MKKIYEEIEKNKKKDEAKVAHVMSGTVSNLPASHPCL